MSERGCDQNSFEDFLYSKDKKRMFHISWRCVIRSCPGRGRGNLEYNEESALFENCKEHNHEPSSEHIRRKAW